MPSCNHGDQSSFRCGELSMQDVRKIHQSYYKEATSDAKKNFILRHVTVSSVKRRKNQEGDGRRMVSTTYLLPKKRMDKVVNVRVCREAMLGILQIKKDALSRLCKKYLEQGTVPKDNRGGARRVEQFDEKKKQ